ncbi:MAG TPA: hypothetical protein VG325_15420 [Solirubrobacteraceae bacterium]|jgi:hypothetical protein|nr:hypothetical protein [Solirubrobacteraceae bacterium]
MPERETPFEREQEDAAAAEAASIGGRVSDEPPPEDAEDLEDPAQRPLTESGQGESEGFEQAEHQLVEHASHGDQHAARRVIEDAFDEPDDDRAAPGSEPDTEQEPDT